VGVWWAFLPDTTLSASHSSFRSQSITGCAPDRVRFYNVDVCDPVQMEHVFVTSPRFQACIHFAGLKVRPFIPSFVASHLTRIVMQHLVQAVGESVQKPLLYYENNLGSTVTLLKLMDRHGCRAIVFSSSATVYGSAAVPITEGNNTRAYCPLILLLSPFHSFYFSLVPAPPIRTCRS